MDKEYFFIMFENFVRKRKKNVFFSHYNIYMAEIQGVYMFLYTIIRFNFK